MVDIKTHGFNTEEETSNLALIYREYCKVMNTISPDIHCNDFAVKELFHKALKRIRHQEHEIFVCGGNAKYIWCSDQ